MKARSILLLIGCCIGTHVSVAQNTEPMPTAVITFTDPEFDFGTIESGEKVSHVFEFTNTGNAPLVITEAKGSCGCTVPFYPSVPIMPGERSEIEVEFNSEGKSGQQSKKVTIIANTSPSIAVLSVKGVVEKTEGEAEQDTELEHRRSLDKQAIDALDPNCFAIFPNPTNEVLQLELKEHIGESALVDIRTETGVSVLSKRIERISRETTLFDVSGFVPGIYIIIIRVDGSKPQSQCFVVTG